MNSEDADTLVRDGKAEKRECKLMTGLIVAAIVLGIMLGIILTATMGGAL
jgi:hypothetical protein